MATEKQDTIELRTVQIEDESRLNDFEDKLMAAVEDFETEEQDGETVTNIILEFGQRKRKEIDSYGRTGEEPPKKLR